MSTDVNLKTEVKDFWNEQSCGEVYANGASDLTYYQSHAKTRYALEPYLFDFAKFHDGKNKDVLEIGVGMGADHIEWAKSGPRSLNGVDLTPRAIEHTQKRLAVYGLTSKVQTADAEKLPFADNSFDIVYSWGVIHHSPNTPEAVNEIFRILRPGGVARIMIYHTYSLTGYMLWARYALLAGHPFTSLREIYAKYLESPGTKAYTSQEARALFANFSQCDIKIQLGFGDLLEGSVGQRHKGMLLTLAKSIWPRWLFKLAFKNHGLYLLIEAKK